MEGAGLDREAGHEGVGEVAQQREVVALALHGAPSCCLDRCSSWQPYAGGISSSALAC